MSEIKNLENYTTVYTQEELVSLLKSTQFDKLDPEKIVLARVINYTPNEVILNVGLKTDAIISSSEFKDDPELKQGDTIEVYIVKTEDEKGNIILSRKKAKIVRTWQTIEESFNQQTKLKAEVKRLIKGGLVVGIGELDCFLPGSQIDKEMVTDFQSYIGKTLDVQTININYKTYNVIVSRKVILQKSLDEEKVELLKNIEKGQIVEAVVKNIANFGAFMSIGDLDGLLHVTEMAWDKVPVPTEVLSVGETVKVVVMDIDYEKKRLSLTLKPLQPNPWDTLPEHIQINQKVKGKIVSIMKYGLFVELAPSIRGLVYVTEITWSKQPFKLDEKFQVGEEVEVLILNIEKENKKIMLSLKQIDPNPWFKKEFKENYKIGAKKKGKIVNITKFGLFVALEKGIEGLVFNTDISHKKITNLRDYFSIGQEIEVMILNINQQEQRLSLSIKDLLPLPSKEHEKKESKDESQEIKTQEVK